MPELPEVETIKNDLKKAILKKKIADIIILKKKSIRNNPEDFGKILKGKIFLDIARIGKLMIFYLEKEKFLLVHLKMTGQLIYCDKSKCIKGGHEMPGAEEKFPNKFTRVIINFQDKSSLYFNDMRRFGYLKIVGEKELEKIKSKFGIEPLTGNFNFKEFKKIFKKRKANVKSILLNQNLIAGIGNIYADEILFASGIKPMRSAGGLSEKELKKIFISSEKILARAIKYRGTTFSDYVDSSGRKGGFVRLLKVYGREGKKCFRCRQAIKKIKIAGRGTRYCPRCQK